LSVNVETNLLSLVSPWLYKFCQITTKVATVLFTHFSPTEHTLGKDHTKQSTSGSNKCHGVGLPKCNVLGCQNATPTPHWRSTKIRSWSPSLLVMVMGSPPRLPPTKASATTNLHSPLPPDYFGHPVSSLWSFSSKEGVSSSPTL
jgi:hypothetical protein